MAVIGTGMALNHRGDQTDSLLNFGAVHARDIHALCADVAAAIFPSAIVPPTEATLTAVSAKLIQIITDIENALENVRRPPITWDILAKSGFLREADLIDCILARVSEDRLQNWIGPEHAVMPIRLLDHAEPNIASAAQMLLAAQSLQSQHSGNSHLALTAELLHKLIWRVVAALEVENGTRQSAVVTSARTIISNYSETNRAQAAARKIVHFAEATQRREMLDPKFAGVDLHVAAISAELELEHDHILRLIDAASSAPYAIMLAAMGVPKKAAIDAIFLFRGETLSTREAGIFDADYADIRLIDARSEIQKWGSARSHYLAFGNP